MTDWTATNAIFTIIFSLISVSVLIYTYQINKKATMISEKSLEISKNSLEINKRLMEINKLNNRPYIDPDKIEVTIFRNNNKIPFSIANFSICNDGGKPAKIVCANIRVIYNDKKYHSERTYARDIVPTGSLFDIEFTKIEEYTNIITSESSENEVTTDGLFNYYESIFREVENNDLKIKIVLTLFYKNLELEDPTKNIRPFSIVKDMTFDVKDIIKVNIN
jgi:hypothetical protein